MRKGRYWLAQECFHSNGILSTVSNNIGTEVYTYSLQMLPIQILSQTFNTEFIFSHILFAHFKK